MRSKLFFSGRRRHTRWTGDWSSDVCSSDLPPIFYSTRSAVLVNFDGDPIWSPIKDIDLKFAVNTNWDVLQHPPTNTFYLRRSEERRVRKECRTRKLP